MNPNQWHQPHKFNPNRFDPEHEWFKTPAGNARHPMSFIPFSFGERKCLGYHFAKTIIPSLVTKIIKSFNFEFVDDYMNDEDWYPVASFL